jgi:site-specific recombinase XerD
MGYSTKIWFGNGYVKADGTIPIGLQIIIERKKSVFPLELRWLSDKLDKKNGFCKARTPNDPDVDDYNIMIRDGIAKANNIFKYYRLTNQKLTMDKFRKDWESSASKESVASFIKQRIKQRLKDKEIGFSTYDDHLKTLKKLITYNEELNFQDFDENWAHGFDAFLKRNIKSYRGDSTNTRWAHHKNIRTYLNYAKKEKIVFENPYQYFSITLVDSSWEAIHERDFLKLNEFYKTTDDARYRVILRRFLFSATTGLRKSDLYRVQDKWLDNGMLRFIPWKTRKKQKRLDIPLSKLAMGYFNDAISEKGSGLLFDDYEEQYSNRQLKVIAKKLGIKKNLHHHVGRHTFITLYLKNGGSLHMAKELAGHSELKTTIGYDHISEERKKEEINYIDKITDYLESDDS